MRPFFLSAWGGPGHPAQAQLRGLGQEQGLTEAAELGERRQERSQWGLRVVFFAVVSALQPQVWPHSVPPPPAPALPAACERLHAWQAPHLLLAAAGKFQSRKSLACHLHRQEEEQNWYCAPLQAPTAPRFLMNLFRTQRRRVPLQNLLAGPPGLLRTSTLLLRGFLPPAATRMGQNSII